MASFDSYTGYFYDEPPPAPQSDEIYSPTQEYQQYINRWIPYSESSQSEVDSTFLLDPQAWEAAFHSPSDLPVFFPQAVADLGYNYEEHNPVVDICLSSCEKDPSADDESCACDASSADEELLDLEGKAYGSQDYL
jgi:hypothetical protein